MPTFFYVSCSKLEVNDRNSCVVVSSAIEPNSCTAGHIRWAVWDTGNLEYIKSCMSTLTIEPTLGVFSQGHRSDDRGSPRTTGPRASPRQKAYVPAWSFRGWAQSWREMKMVWCIQELFGGQYVCGVGVPISKSTQWFQMQRSKPFMFNRGI